MQIDLASNSLFGGLRSIWMSTGRESRSIFCSNIGQCDRKMFTGIHVSLGTCMG